MLIDWFTVAAQLINFLLLLWLMKHFLYKPILNAIDVREKKISDKLANADTKQAEAQKASDEFKNKNEKFDNDRIELLNKATEDAKERGDELLKATKKEIEHLRLKHQEAMRNDQNSLGKEIHRRAQEEIFSISRKTLQDLAGITLEVEIIHVFIKKIREINSDDKIAFTKALSSTNDSPLIRSSFEISQDQKTQIELAIKEVFGFTLIINCEVNPTLIAGIELRSGGHKIAWSVSDYLDSLKHSVNEVLKSPSQSTSPQQPSESTVTGVL